MIAQFAEVIIVTFYEKFVLQCNKIGKAPSRVGLEIGGSKAMVNGWKTGKSNPTDANLQKLAEYFGCAVEDLEPDKEKEPAGSGLVNDDAELTAYLEELRTRPEMRMLFHTFAGATKEQVEAIVKAWEAMQQK